MNLKGYVGGIGGGVKRQSRGWAAGRVMKQRASISGQASSRDMAPSAALSPSAHTGVLRRWLRLAAEAI
ncbi:MAG: hypothetical protein A2269_04905 [Lentisphaerae bacterium RIFOXYA12_FULL_60_10]|nr:MAG: hypothetical protein A2269_04905 [Lentisphaerae bacterium RIFOXYA12_FULL_60_10]